MNSMPARSAIWHMAAMSSQLAAQRSGAKLMVRPPSQLALNTPSLNLFGPRIGLVVRVSVMACSSRLSDRGVDAARRIRNQGRLCAPDAMYLRNLASRACAYQGPLRGQFETSGSLEQASCSGLLLLPERTLTCRRRHPMLNCAGYGDLISIARRPVCGAVVKLWAESQ